MIIDSHAHYTTNRFLGEYRYLTFQNGEYTAVEGNLTTMMEAFLEAGIVHSIEPAIDLASNERILAICRAHPDRLSPVLGCHPTRCIKEKWADRKKLARLIRENNIVAVGETGLDYHHPRKEQQRFKQFLWFWYQLGLAQKAKLPLVLHIRQADRDALRILKFHPARKNGGVVHCFNGDWATAQQYLAMGFHIGIGGSLLQKPENSQALEEAVRHIPLDRILIETDAPYVHPYFGEGPGKKPLKKSRNCSMILPVVIARIAELKNISPETVAEETAKNAIRLFGLKVNA